MLQKANFNLRPTGITLCQLIPHMYGNGSKKASSEKCLKNRMSNRVSSSASIFAEVSVSSAQKIFSFIIYKVFSRSKFQKNISFNDKWVQLIGIDIRLYV